MEQVKVEKYKVLQINCGANIYDCSQRQIVALPVGMENKISNRVTLEYLARANHLYDGYEIFSTLIPGDIVVVETKIKKTEELKENYYVTTYKEDED